ncbi:hypothetical protein EZV62_026496 [Acer yangbiense]|uniref:Gnk2-homologous domain-containing protein n=1 Tax=Acer yangbiense TaxID=1000413 RepID=A0A5C7GSC2_9ROSI|nr:hypothetical protein EZV62_026496 [Acer yangbiense]
MLIWFVIWFVTFKASAGLECSKADKSTSEDEFQTNLKKLLNSLAAEAPYRNGFYKSREGKDSNKVYGIVQCRGEVSVADCANCSQESISIALHDCSKSKQVKVWLKWCFLRYSDEDFIGDLDRISVAHTNETNLDDPSVSQRGFTMMTELAATTPKQPLMFKTAMLDTGDKGKRYGMAQCNRDISSADCDSYLAGQLMSFRTTVGNVREWEIYGSMRVRKPSLLRAVGLEEESSNSSKDASRPLSFPKPSLLRAVGLEEEPSNSSKDASRPLSFPKPSWVCYVRKHVRKKPDPPCWSAGGYHILICIGRDMFDAFRSKAGCSMRVAIQRPLSSVVGAWSACSRGFFGWANSNVMCLLFPYSVGGRKLSSPSQAVAIGMMILTVSKLLLMF